MIKKQKTYELKCLTEAIEKININVSDCNPEDDDSDDCYPYGECNPED